VGQQAVMAQSSGAKVALAHAALAASTSHTPTQGRDRGGRWWAGAGSLAHAELEVGSDIEPVMARVS